MGADENLLMEEPRRRSLALLQSGKLRGLKLYQALLDAAQAVRYDNPQMMVDLAALAVKQSGGLNSRRYGVRKVADYRCRALIELGNAHRVADQLDAAGSALGEATVLWEEGSRDELLQARLFDIQASLFADRRRFAAAAQALDTVHAIHLRRGDSHMAGRALISKGIYTGYAGDQEEALRLLRQGHAQIDPEREPSLEFSAVQSQGHFLVMLGRFREARKLLWCRHFSPEVLGARVNQLKLRWLKSQIQAGLGDVQRAEEGLLEVKRGFEEAKLYYKAALVGLELAHLWHKQGRLAEVKEVVAGLAQVFRGYQVHREALAALLLLETALEEGVEAGAILDSVSEFIRKRELNPDLTFESWFLAS